MKISNFYFYLILFIISFLFSTSYYLNQNYKERNLLRDNHIFKPIVNINQYKIIEKEKEKEKENKNNLLIEKKESYVLKNNEDIKYFLNMFYENFKYQNTFINEGDYCIIEIKNIDNYSILECSNKILKRYIKLTIELLIDENRLKDKKIYNKKIKIYNKKI